MTTIEWQLEHLEKVEQGEFLVGRTVDGLPITIEKKHERLWLSITVYDEYMQDGREIEYELVRRN